MAAALRYSLAGLAIILVWSGMLFAASARNLAADPITLELTGSQAAQTMLSALDRRGEKGPFILRQGSKDDKNYLLAFTRDTKRGSKAVRAFDAEYRQVEESMIMDDNPRISVVTVPIDGFSDYCERFGVSEAPKF